MTLLALNDPFCSEHVSDIVLLFRFSPQIAPSRCGIGSPVSHMVPMATRVITLNSILISSAGFVWVPNDMLYNALSRGRKAPKLPLHLGSCHPAGQGPSHSHRQHAQKNWFKIAHVVPEMSWIDRQTDRQTCSILCHRSSG